VGKMHDGNPSSSWNREGGTGDPDSQGGQGEF
jgi:hypothetical protein